MVDFDSIGTYSTTSLTNCFYDGGVIRIEKYIRNVDNFVFQGNIEYKQKKVDNMNERKAKTNIIRKFNNDRMKYAKHLK